MPSVAFAAAGGGAQSINLPPHIEEDKDAQRIARNIWHVLREEGHLSRVADPAAGSWLAENLTTQLAQTAWSHLQKILPDSAVGELGRPADHLPPDTKNIFKDILNARKYRGEGDLYTTRCA